ncbi:MAG: cellulase family glycosylhydrolase [Bacteroidota bacterium]|nr:cellulase family glycosylhydrolase [Bacteroidota bacterium]
MTRFGIKGFVYFLFLFCITKGASAQSFLHTEGQNIVNEQGKRVLLQGVGLGNWMLPEGYMWKFGEHGDRPRKIEKIVADHIGQEKADKFWKAFRRNYITEADIKRIAELGFNSVRPALNARLFLTEGENNQFVDEGFELLDNLIKWCKKYHLYVIVDMHGAPGGQTGQNIDDSPNNKPELFSDPKNEDLLVKLWVKIAEKYKDEPTVAAYDLLNEPLPERTGAAEQYKDRLVPMYQKLIAAIRTVDKKHMFTLEGYNWANNWSVFNKALDSNMFFQFHYYCWDRPDNLNDISNYLKKQQQLNTPVWVGETGEKNNAIYFATTQYFEKHNIGWSFWPWKKMDTQNTPYSIKSPDGWKEIAAYSRNGKDITATDAEKIFNQLLENIKLENCVYFPDVVNSLFRCAPLKLEAENYGHDGYLKSYFVKDTLAMSAHYRKKEPVKVVVINNDEHSLISGQVVELGAGEWTAYKIKSTKKAEYNVSLQLKAIDSPSSITVVINGKSTNLKVEQTEYSELKLNPQAFKQGENDIKVEVKTGRIGFDWINIY